MTEQCDRFLTSKKQRCENQGVVNYVIKDELKGIHIWYTLCRTHSPNISLEQKKRLGDKKFD